MLKTIVFDLDNTLHDFDAYLRNAYQHLVEKWSSEKGMEHEKVSAAMKVVIAEHGLTNDYLFNKWFEQMDFDYARVDITRAVEFFHSYEPQSLNPFEGFEELMNTCDHLTKVILSDGKATTQHKKLKALGISGYFDHIILSSERSTEKPDHSLFREIEETTDCKPEEVLMVGDHPDKDILGAKRAGWKAVRMGFGAHAEKPNQKEYAPDFEVCNLIRLKNILENEKSTSSRSAS